MLCLGIDPDTHDLAIASWDDQGPVAAHVVSVPKKITGTDAVLAMMQELTKPWPDLGRYDAILRQCCLPDWCAVEGQELARGPGAQHRRPEDIVRLGQVAGMAVMRVARGYLHGCGLYMPKPSEWKGSVPKAAMQARLYTELGWGYDLHGKGSSSYAVPKCPPAGFDFGAEWKHVGDALLLARWCWEQASGKPWKRVG